MAVSQGSSPKSADFTELRERNERDLGRAGFAPDLRLAELPSRAQARIRDLLGRRAEIEMLASTQAQREAYGVEAWHHTFTRRRELPIPEWFRGDSARLWHALWKELPNSQFKRFQELFAAAYNFILPEADLGGRVPRLRCSRRDLLGLSVAPCLVSPDLLPEKLVEDLKLVSFTDSDRRHPLRRLRKKAEPAVVDGIKLIWDSCVPLQEGQLRLLIVKPPPAALLARYPRAAGPDSQISGSILYTREDAPGRGGAAGAQDYPLARRLSVQYFSSVYSAYRKTLHEAREHALEIPRLADLQQELKTFAMRLDREWRRAAPLEVKQRLQAEGAELVARGVALLESCLNAHKFEAREYLLKVGDFTDRSGKLNPSVTMNRLAVSAARLERRFREMFPIGGYNQSDRMALERELRRHEEAIIRFGRLVRQNASCLERTNPLFDNPDLGLVQQQLEASRLWSSLEVHPEMLAEIRVRPFVTFAARLRDKWRELEQAVGNRDRGGAEDALIKMHVIGKFHAANASFEKMQTMMLSAESVPLSQVRDFAARLQAIFDDFQIFPSRIVESYRASFEELQGGLRSLQERMAGYAAQDVDINSRTKIYRELKQYLQSFDIERMVRDLP